MGLGSRRRSALSSSRSIANVDPRGSGGLSRIMPFPSITLLGAAAIFLSSGVLFQQTPAAAGAEVHHQIYPQLRESGVINKHNYVSFIIQTIILVLLIILLLVLRFQDGKRMEKLSGRYILSVPELNNVKILGQVFMSYLQAAILEPILSLVEIGNREAPTRDYDYYSKIVLNILVLGSLCWWIWLLTDAFDYVDIVQQFKYRSFEEEVNADKVKWHWLKIRTMDDVSREVKSDLVGSLKKDVALWLCLIAIIAAWYPDDIIGVNQRDAVHAYAIVFFWVLMHHRCRAATCWGPFYLVSLFLPSTALMPIQYCVPFIDCFDVVDDLASVDDLRNFVRRRTGVELVIHN